MEIVICGRIQSNTVFHLTNSQFWDSCPPAEEGLFLFLIP